MVVSVGALRGRAGGLSAPRRPHHEQRGRGREPLQAHLADRLELEPGPVLDGVGHPVGDQHLAGLGPVDHTVSEVDLAAEVVAVAVDGLSAVDADPGLRALREAGQKADRPLGQRSRIGRDDHHLVADRLHDRRLRRQRRLDRLDEALDQVQRLQVTLLLGVAGEAGDVDEAEGDRDLTEVGRLRPQFGLHVADHVLLEEEAQVAGVQVLGERCRQRQDVGCQPSHLLGHLQLRHRVADHRLVDVEVEQPHLGVGDAANGLHVDTDQLQEGDEGEAGGKDAGAVAQGGDVAGVENPLAPQRGAEDAEDALDQLRLEAGLLRHLLDRDLLLGLGEQLFGEAEGKPALAAGPLQVGQRVAPLAHPRHDPGLCGRGRRPAAPLHGDDLLLRPAFQRAGRDARAAGRLAERYALVGNHRGSRLAGRGDLQTERLIPSG